jgi:hypothetical protein
VLLGIGGTLAAWIMLCHSTKMPVLRFMPASNPRPFQDRLTVSVSRSWLPGLT